MASRRLQGGLWTNSTARARFPLGALAQERETLAIETLMCVGDDDEASARAAAFLRDYPNSPHAEAVLIPRKAGDALPEDDIHACERRIDAIDGEMR